MGLGWRLFYFFGNSSSYYSDLNRWFLPRSGVLNDKRRIKCGRYPSLQRRKALFDSSRIVSSWRCDINYDKWSYRGWWNFACKRIIGSRRILNNGISCRNKEKSAYVLSKKLGGRSLYSLQLYGCTWNGDYACDGSRQQFLLRQSFDQNSWRSSRLPS